jgi:flavin-dependent dehydrogenase
MLKSVIIVGGGTAGWMTASYLKTAFQDRIDITVVESGQIRTIGVGEATFSDIRHFFEFLGLREEDWMPACNASYKLAVRFQDWRRPGHHFYHPFEQMRSVDGFALTDWWLHAGSTERFDTECFVMANVCDAGRGPRHLDGSLVDDSFQRVEESRGLTMSEHQGKTQFPYAYHFEAALLAKFLTSYSVDRGVEHIVDDVTDVTLDERGWISGLTTAEHGTVSGDLYIDCTGFRGVLLNKALKEPFISFQDTLPNDSAVALQVPVDMYERGVNPFTQATAQKNGWIWTIPLFSRIGTGYVYASDYTTPEEAEQTLRDYVGPAAKEAEANHIKMRIGRSERSWVNNCVGIGLTSGFVEPLESTGIFFIHHAIEQLVKNFPDERWDPSLAEEYNTRVAGVLDGVKEFLVLHYAAAGRSDTRYWKEAKIRQLPDGLAERLEIASRRLLDEHTIYPRYHGFEKYSWISMLLGLGHEPRTPRPVLAHIDPAGMRAEFAAVRADAKRLVDMLPGCHEYLASIQRGADGGN